MSREPVLYPVVPDDFVGLDPASPRAKILSYAARTGARFNVPPGAMSLASLVDYLIEEADMHRDALAEDRAAAAKLAAPFAS